MKIALIIVVVLVILWWVISGWSHKKAGQRLSKMIEDAPKVKVDDRDKTKS